MEAATKAYEQSGTAWQPVLSAQQNTENTMANPNPVNTTLTPEFVVGEIMETIRHYSNLRFAMMPVYIAITGGLAIAALTDQVAGGASPLKWWFWLAGMITAVTFLIFELALSWNLGRLWKGAAAVAGNSAPQMFQHRNEPILWVVRLSWVSIYAGSIVFWFMHR